MRRTGIWPVLGFLLLGALRAHAAGCDVYLVDQGGRSVPSASFSALHYVSTFRLYVKTSTPACHWTLDVTNAPAWLSFRIADGGFLPRQAVGFNGPATLDVLFAANTGYARSGKFTIHAPAYDIRAFVDQRNRTGVCLHKPVPGEAGEWAVRGEGEFLLLLRRWGSKSVSPGRNTIFQVTDSSGCPADGILYAVTPRLAGASIITPGVYQNGQQIVISLPYATPNDRGEGAVFGLRGSGGNVGPSAIGTIILPARSSLPADLQISYQGALPVWAVFASTGGVIEIGSAVTRSTADPKRRCAFDPSLYTVVAGVQQPQGLPWVWIARDATKCLGGNPDRGVISLVAGPNTTGSPRYAIIYDAWGWATMIVQAAGG